MNYQLLLNCNTVHREEPPYSKQHLHHLMQHLYHYQYCSNNSCIISIHQLITNISPLHRSVFAL
jgi:hypothetical protein